MLSERPLIVHGFVCRMPAFRCHGLTIIALDESELNVHPMSLHSGRMYTCTLIQ